MLPELALKCIKTKHNRKCQINKEIDSSTSHVAVVLCVGVLLD